MNVPAPDFSKRTATVLSAVVLTLIGLLLLVRLNAFGIWDPWELNAADDARRVASGDWSGIERAPLPTWLVSLGFHAFGVREWAGRVPMVVMGIATAGLALALVWRFAGSRAGVYAAIVCGTTPLFLFNARQMVGDATAFAAQALVVLAAASAVYVPVRDHAKRKDAWVATGVWLVVMLVAVALAVLARGALLGALAPLLAVAIATGFTGDLAYAGRDTRRTAAAYAVLLTGGALLVLVVMAVQTDAAQYTPWIGGSPRGGNPPTFDLTIDDLFHAFAPWSALLPLAFGRMLTAPATRTSVTPAEGTRAAPAPAGWSPDTGKEPPADGEASAAEKTAPPDAATDGAEHAARSTPIAFPDASGDTDEATLRIVLIGWAILGYAAATIFSARWGATTFVPVVAVSGAVALFLRDVERSGRGWWAAAIVGTLLVALVIRDFALYPGTPVEGLPLTEVTVPDVFNPASRWAAVLGVFALCTFFALGVDPGRERPSFAAPYALVVAQWRRGIPFKIWLVLGAVVLVALQIAGVIAASRGDDTASALTRAFHGWAWAASWVVIAIALAVRLAVDSLLQKDGVPNAALGDRRGVRILLFVTLGVLVVSGVVFGIFRVTNLVERAGVVTIAVTWLRRLGLVPGLVPVGIVVLQLLLWAFRRLGSYRLVPLLVAGAIVGAYASQGFLPALSGHFSPREIYDTYNSLAARGEPLAEFRVGGRAAAYYARAGSVQEVADQGALVSFLAGAGRRWAAFPTDDLAQVNRAFRGRTQRHLFVVDARSARVVLATNQPIAEHENENFVAQWVRDSVPAVQHHVGANFDDKIELVGYDLDLPHGSYVGAGESFTITWVFRAITSGPSGYKVFVHVDGAGNRLNGDHDPVDERYPVRLWDRGDVVLDRQRLSVPGNYRPGEYTLFMGFFSGETRLHVTAGPRDEDNRVRAGGLTVR